MQEGSTSGYASPDRSAADVEAARKRMIEMEDAARKKAAAVEEEARKRAAEMEGARKRAEEDAARKRAEEDAARKRAEEDAARKRAAEDAAAARVSLTRTHVSWDNLGTDCASLLLSPFLVDATSRSLPPEPCDVLSPHSEGREGWVLWIWCVRLRNQCLWKGGGGWLVEDIRWAPVLVLCGRAMGDCDSRCERACANHDKGTTKRRV